MPLLVKNSHRRRTRYNGCNYERIIFIPITKNFHDTVKARADRDPAFRAGLYQEAVRAVLDDDFPTSRILLRDFINATIGFAAPAESPPSL